MKAIFSKRHIFTSAVSILLSVFTVAVVAYGASLVNTSSIGSGTTTPGAAVGAKGAGIFEGFVSADYFTSTSTNTSWLMGGNFGLGTTTPGAKLGVRGGVIVDDFVYMNNFTATSTTATSTTKFGIDFASSSLIVDGTTGRVAIGTTTFADSDAGATWALDPSLTVSAVGSANNATATVYIAGEGATGGQIILKSSDGTRCGSLVFDSEGGAQGTMGALIIEVVDCPR